ATIPTLGIPQPHHAIQLFPDEPLESNCERAWNIRNHCGIATAYPFDWWITPHDSVVKLLTSNFSQLLTPEALKLSHNRETVRCENYNILHHHDFERDEFNMVLPDLARKFPDCAKNTRR
ncbi:MAG: hypothetical protein ACREDR_35930, partial [Blastocatellia bacterium]